MLRHTRQRQIILEELRKLNTHPTAMELYQVVHQRMSSVSLATIYRNLDLLVQTGKILKLEGVGSQFRFDGTIQPHNHVRCIECGALDDIPSHAKDLPERTYKSSNGFRILGSRLEFVGLCPACQDGSQRGNEKQRSTFTP